MIMKTSSRLLAAVLAAVLLSGAAHLQAATESIPPANADVSSGMTFTPLKFRSIFNMTEEESKRSIHSSSISNDLLTGELVMKKSTRKLNTKYLNSIGVKSKDYDFFQIKK